MGQPSMINSSPSTSSAPAPSIFTPPLSLDDLLFFELVFDFFIAPSIELATAASASQGCLESTSILTRLRYCYVKYQLMLLFLTQLASKSSAQQPASSQLLASCFVESALALGLRFS